MTKGVTVIDRGWNKIVRIFKQGGDMAVYTGIQSDGVQEHEGITNAELGAIHEFGAPSKGIPERSFLRAPFDKHKNSYLRILKKGAQAMSEGRATKEDVLGIIGEKIQANSVRAIDNGIMPMRKQARRRRLIRFKDGKRYSKITRKTSKPLIDTGAMKQSIRWVIKKR